MQIMTYARRILALFIGPIAYEVARAQDAAAGTTTAETVVGCSIANPANPTGPSKVLRVYYVPAAGVTAHDSNYATITVSKYTAAGASKTTVATITTQTTGGGGSGDWTALVPMEITLSSTLANRIVEPKATLTYEIAKASSGVQLPAGKLVVVLGDAY